MNLLTVLDMDMTWWNDFWKKVGDFFWVADEHGINYLTRILMAIVLILIGWLVIKFMVSY